MVKEEPVPDRPLEYDLRKYLLLLATLVATVTYAAGFNPPGGVWQETEAGHLAGDSIIRETYHPRYIMFFYCNAAAFALSIVVIVLIFILAVLHEKKGVWIPVFPLRFAMVLNLVGLTGAYAAGTSRHAVKAGNLSALAAVFSHMVAQTVVTQFLGKKLREESSKGTGNPPSTEHYSVEAISPVLSQEESQPVDQKEEENKRHRKVLMLLATFVMSITYVAGLSAPGGYWESSQEGHHAGDPVLWEHHSVRLRAFFIFNTMAFVASLLITMLLLDKKQQIIFLTLDMRRKTITGRTHVLYAYITIALLGLVGAYVSGSCRHSDTTVYVLSLVAAVLVCIAILQVVLRCLRKLSSETPKSNSRSGENNPKTPPAKSSETPNNGDTHSNTSKEDDILEKAKSLVVPLSTLVATVTYQAGLVPPGGVWQENQGGHKAGEPILMSTQAKRYKMFFYCNSTAFAASLVIIILVQYKPLLRRRILEVAIIVDLFGLVGAYAAGSCRDVNTSIYVIALVGAVLVYVVIHVVLFTLEEEDKNKKRGLNPVQNDPDSYLHKRRKRLLLFAVLGATLTYQAGLTPPGGFRLVDDELSHRAGDPVLFYNYPRRYKAFFYCNSLSFMSSIALIILLVNPILYRPAIRSYALSICIAAGLFALMSAYAAGSTQHLITSIYVFALAVLLLLLMILFLGLYYWKKGMTKSVETPGNGKDEVKAKQHAKRKYLMLLGVLAASVTYQAGLNPPGGVWQRVSGGHIVGDPVLHDNVRHRYHIFFYSNSISFVASIVVIILLLPEELLRKKNRWLMVMNVTIVLDLLGLLVAYVSGSSMRWKPSVFVMVMVVAALGCAAAHKFLSIIGRSRKQQQGSSLV